VQELVEADELTFDDEQAFFKYDYPEAKRCRIHKDKVRTGHVIRYNYITDVQGLVQADIFVDCGSMYHHDMDASNTRFCRNIFSYHAPKSATDRRVKKLKTHLYDMYSYFDQWIQTFDDNLFFNADGSEIVPVQIGLLENKNVPKQFSFAEWQKMGFDEHSIIADPLFVDPENDDYRLKSDSPAFKLGFRQINIEKIGLITKNQNKKGI